MRPTGYRWKRIDGKYFPDAGKPMRDLLGSAVVALFSVSLLIGAASFPCAEQFTNEGIPPKSTSQYLRSHFQHLRTHAELHFDTQKSELHLVQDIQKCLPGYYSCAPCSDHEIGTCCTNDQKCACVENTSVCE
jgi:hypothetical protein